MKAKIRTAVLQLKQGDLTAEAVDAIVNAANSSLLGGGGVDGAIHRAAGPTLLEECKRVRAERGTCAPGEAVITGGGNLKARFVIHTVGPIWQGGGRGEPDVLASAYRRSLERAAAAGARRVAFPSISTGAFGYPVADAARVALDAVAGWLNEHATVDAVTFVLYDARTFEAYKRALRETHGAAVMS
ncbi:MAG: O-acetyl-ADP-ribose deacetylase [Planctomycetes bacterium]|nr:O-acetyl-ADP-ribose deacetylase [Planctomycetota bacterium]